MIGLWFLASISFVVVLTVIPPITAAPIETSTAILSDVGVVGPNDTIQFTVWVFSGFDPVPTGPVRITDTNTSESVVSTILGGKSVVNWTISDFEEGIHIFEAVYQGFLDYSPSSGICQVNFDDFSPGDSRVTSITLDVNSTVVFKNASIRFTVELMIHYRWYFQGGYIYVKNTNLSGSPTVHTYGPLPSYFPGTDPAVMTYSFDYKIPLFSLVGINSFIAEYTGSSQSGTFPCTSGSQNITVMSTGYWLVQNLDLNDLQREEDTLKLNTTVLGDYPVGLELYSYYYLGLQKVIIDDQILESRNVIANFTPNNSVPVGIMSIITELVDPSTEFQYANSTEEVWILDRARIDHSENATEYRHNETIKFEIYVTEEDVHTHSVVSKVELIDVTDGNHSLLNKTTNQDGFAVIDYLIPDNSTIGSHEFSLRTHDTNEFIIDITETFPINIKGLTEIDLTYVSDGVDRNTITVIDVTVLSGAAAISEGFVALEFAINSSAIETKDCEPGLEFNYFIEAYHPSGVMGYKVHFFGSPNYDDHVEPFDLAVFSNPTFNITGRNASEVIKGQIVRIWGQLVDEIGQPVTYEEVELTDTTIGMFLGTSETDDQGIFYYDYFISQSTQIGVHFVEITYSGNIFEFYRSSTNNPVISITVRPPLSVLIEAEVVSDHWAIISLEGGLDDEIALEWQKSGETDWIYLTSVILNSTGQGYYNWSIPYYKGDFTIRAIGPNSTKYDFSTIYAIPHIAILGDEVGNVNDPYPFTVNSTEIYQIWIGGQLWQDWREDGIHQYEYVFTNRGMKEIIIISNETYVYYQEYHHSIVVFEEVFVTLSAPLEALVNVTVNFDGTVIGEVSGPIQGIDATLEVNGTEIQVDSTNGAGRYYFSFAFETPSFYSLIVKIPLSETDFYYAAFSDESIILINSIPAAIQILSPLNQTYGAIVEVSIAGDAQNYWYRIEPVDSTNISWNYPIYRNLVEGNYTCHVYGQNAYGIVTHIYSDFTIDTTAPSLVLINPENTTYTTNEILLSYLTNEDEVLVLLDGLELDGVAAGSLLTDLAEGNHNLSITTQDQVGNNVTRFAFFDIDTIPPSLKIYSPYNQSYTGDIEISLGSNGSTVLFFIPNLYTYNQTYTEPISLYNLSIGDYILKVYAFDDAGNVHVESVSFFIVQTIELLIDPAWEISDGAGNYIIHTQIMSHPNFDKIGIYLNGTYRGSLEWNFIYQDYRLAFQLEVPGLWELTLCANTILEEYDFHYFEIEWDPPVPVFESISIMMDSSYFELRVQIDTGSLILEIVQVFFDETPYDLVYEYFGDRWVGNLPINPQNDTLLFYAWYPWDVDPSGQKEHDIHWFAPSIIIEDYITRRENFSLGIRVERQNASIDTQSVILVINNGSFDIDVAGTLVYESLSGSFQQWEFNSPNLPHKLWNYTIRVTDVYGSQQILNKTFDATDFLPIFGNESVILIASYTTGELWRVEVPVSDDYKVDRVFLYVDGVENTAISQNGTHFVFEVWLNEGIHSLQLVAYDDINQITTKILPSIDVTFDQSIISTTNSDDITASTSTSSSDEVTPETREGGEIKGIIEIGLAGGVFVGLVAGGNFLNRKRRV